MKINQVTIHNLEVELQTFHQHAKKQAKVINVLQEQSEKKMTELTENAALYMAVSLLTICCNDPLSCSLAPHTVPIFSP